MKKKLTLVGGWSSKEKRQEQNLIGVTRSLFEGIKCQQGDYDL
jgi:hypothetical protein